MEQLIKEWYFKKTGIEITKRCITIEKRDNETLQFRIGQVPFSLTVKVEENDPRSVTEEVDAQYFDPASSHPSDLVEDMASAN